MGVVNYSQLATIDPTAPVVKYSSELRRQAIPRDIYTNLRGDHIIYQGQRTAIPNGIYTKMKASDLAGANSVNVLMKLPIRANILRGNAVAMGTEIPPDLLNSRIYRNNYRFVVQDTPGYGENRLDAEPYRLYQEHANDLAPHAAAEEGKEIRMALLESNSWNLMAGSTVNVCPAQWNRNFYVIGCPMPNQPQFNPTWATYTNNIVSAIDRAAGGNGTGNSGFVQTAPQMLTCNDLDNICRWAMLQGAQFGNRLIPLVKDGRSCFVLSVSALGAHRFSDPNFVDSGGDRWTTAGQLVNKEIQDWYGIYGRYRAAAGADIYVVLDERLPTLLPSGSAPPFGLAPGYMWPTDVDLRNLTNAFVRDAMILHGAGSIVNWEPEKLHMIHQDWDYSVRNGVGYAGNRGIQQLQFDTSPVDPTGANRYYGGSAIIVGGRAEP